MFERYTEQARRILFFARYEASQLGSISIEAEHLLLGLIREGKGLTSQIFARFHVSPDGVREEIERRNVFHEKLSTSVEIPFSSAVKRALQYAAEESSRLLHTYIGTEHLLLGLLRVDQSTATTILNEAGLQLDAVRETIVELLSRDAAQDHHPSSLGMPLQAKTPDFVPSYDVHFMYSRAATASSVSAARECALCGFTLKAAIAKLWETDESRIELPPALATYQRYDIVAKLPRDESRETVRTLVKQAIERQFDVEVARESRPSDVYTLTAQPGQPGQASRSQSHSQSGSGFVSSFTVSGPGEHSMFPMNGFSFAGMPAPMLVQFIEQIVGRPVVDETGLTGFLELELRTSIRNAEAFIAALRDEAGLILSPARRDIQALVVRPTSKS
jgi:uncharacterized protein (TIGR03435 family)